VQIKQLVDIFVNRTELMPADENKEQHIKRKKEESQSVEADRSAQNGLFKGCFSTARLGHIRYDEADRLYVCNHCGHEFTGGQRCENCDVDFEGEDEALRDDFSDLEDMEFDLDEDLDLDIDEDEDDDDSHLDFGDWHARHFSIQPHSIHELLFEGVRDSAGHRLEEISSDESAGDSDEEETTSSLRDFIVEEDEDESSAAVRRSSRPLIIDSDSEGSNDSDEISIGRHRQRARRRTSRPVVVESDSEADDAISVDSRGIPRGLESDEHSEGGYEIGGYIRNGGWSPLNQDEDSENDVDLFAGLNSDDFRQPRSFVSEDTDTSTTVGNQASEDEDDENQRSSEGSSTPRLVAAPDPPRRSWHQSGIGLQARNRTITEHRNRNARREEQHKVRKEREREQSTSITTSEGGSSEDDEDVTDHDGDVEMSVSPAVATSRGSSQSTEVLGDSNAVRDLDESSSDGSIQPANRRHRPQQMARRGSNSQEYDHRIGMMFAQHQSDLRDVITRQSPFVDQRRDLGSGIEPSSRSRRRVQYAVDPPVLGSPSRVPRDVITISSPLRSRRGHRRRREYPS
jgi:hypothetical protein